MRRGNAPDVAVNGFRKQATLRYEMQQALRRSMEWWFAARRTEGRSDREAYKMFYLTFGIDALGAQALGRPDALKLANKVNERLEHGSQ